MAQVYGRNNMSKNNPLVENTQDKNRKRFRDTPIHLPTYAPLGSLTDGKPVSVWTPSGMAISWPHEATHFIFGCLANTVQHPFLFPEQHQLPLGKCYFFTPCGSDRTKRWCAASPLLALTASLSSLTFLSKLEYGQPLAPGAGQKSVDPPCQIRAFDDFSWLFRDWRQPLCFPHLPFPLRAFKPYSLQSCLAFWGLWS